MSNDPYIRIGELLAKTDTLWDRAYRKEDLQAMGVALTSMVELLKLQLTLCQEKQGK